MYELRTDVNSVDKEPVVWYLVNEKRCVQPEDILVHKPPDNKLTKSVSRIAYEVKGRKRTPKKTEACNSYISCIECVHYRLTWIVLVYM
jgi:hypothetical protein